MLVEKYGVAVGIGQKETRRAGRGFICLGIELHTFLFQQLLQVPYIGKVIHYIGILVLSGIESQNILIEHSLEQPYQ